MVYLSIDLLSADKCTILHNGQCGANHLATHLHHYYNTAVYEKGSNSCICFRSILLSGGGQGRDDILLLINGAGNDAEGRDKGGEGGGGGGGTPRDVKPGVGDGGGCGEDYCRGQGAASRQQLVVRKEDRGQLEV